MFWILSLLLLVAWGIWFSGLAGIVPMQMGAYAMLVGYIGATLGLLNVSLPQPLLRSTIRWMGVGLALAIVSQLVWALFYPDGAQGNEIILPNLPMYVASLIFAWCATRIYREARRLFTISSVWLILPFLGSLALTLYLFLFGPEMTSQTVWNIVSHNFIAVLATFTSLMMIGVSWSTSGGAWGRWLIAPAVGFTFYFIGAVLSALDTHYTVGEPSDWCWMLASSVLIYFALSNLRPKQSALAT